MKAISLFAGCGGMDLGAHAAGVETIFANDNMAEATATYRKCFPNTEVVNGDIAQVTSFPEAELVFGGYPCQSSSMGGNRDPGLAPIPVS